MELKDALDKVNKGVEKVRKRLERPAREPPETQRRKRQQTYQDRINERMKGKY